MERKTKHRILGFFVVIGLAIILLPFFQSNKEPLSEARLVKTPPFPDQSVQVNSDASSESTTEQSSAIPIHQTSDESQINQQPDDTISVVKPSVVNTQTPDTTHPTEAVATPTTDAAASSDAKSTAAVAELDTAKPSTDTPATSEVKAENAELAAPAVSAEDDDMQSQKTADVVKSNKDATPKNEMIRDVSEAEDIAAKPASSTSTAKHAVKAKKVAHLAKNTHTKLPPIAANVPLSNNGLVSLKNAAWVIQVGSYKNKANALRIVNQLRANGYRAFIQQISTALGDSTRVFVGPMPKQNSARQLATQLESDLHMRGIVISYKPLTL